MKNTDQSNFEKWLRGRTHSLPEAEVSSEFLAAQRRSIYGRMNEPHRAWSSLRWALSLAVLIVMIAGGLTLQRGKKPAPTTLSDDQLFSDLSAMEQSSEPKAIQPLHGLFQE